MAKDIRQCTHCFFRETEKTGGGEREWCRTQNHKITKGQTDCPDFKWD